MIKDIDLSIVIPCFNEAKNITIVLKKLEQMMLSRQESIEVIVVDGASTDGTPQELEAVFKYLPTDRFKLILNHERNGYGGDIMKAIKMASGKILSWTHADLQTDPEDILKAWREIGEKGVELEKSWQQILSKKSDNVKSELEKPLSFLYLFTPPKPCFLIDVGIGSASKIVL